MIVFVFPSVFSAVCGWVGVFLGVDVRFIDVGRAGLPRKEAFVFQALSSSASMIGFVTQDGFMLLLFARDLYTVFLKMLNLLLVSR